MRLDDWLMLGVVSIGIVGFYKVVVGSGPKPHHPEKIAAIPLMDMTAENSEKFTRIPNLWGYPQGDDLCTCSPSRIIQIIGNNSGKKRYKIQLRTVAFEWMEGWPYVRGLGAIDLTSGKEGFLAWDEIKGIYDESTGKTYRASATMSEFLRLSVGGVIDADFKKL